MRHSNPTTGPDAGVRRVHWIARPDHGLSAGARIAVTRPVPFQVETGSSRIYIKVGATGRFGHAHGVHGRLVSGKVDLGGSGELVFDMRSFVVNPPEARQYVGLGGGVLALRPAEDDRGHARPIRPRRGAPPQGDVHDRLRHAARRPGAGDPGRYQLDGQLTLRGVARRLPIAAIVERTETPGLFRLLGASRSCRLASGSLPTRPSAASWAWPTSSTSGASWRSGPHALIAIPPGEDDG